MHLIIFNPKSYTIYSLIHELGDYRDVETRDGFNRTLMIQNKHAIPKEETLRGGSASFHHSSHSI